MSIRSEIVTKSQAKHREKAIRKQKDAVILALEGLKIIETPFDDAAASYNRGIDDSIRIVGLAIG